MAGELPSRRFLPHDPPHWVPEWEPFFITICCIPRGRNQLCQPAHSQPIIDSIRAGETRGIWRIGLVVLMPDHLHGIFHFNPVPGMRIAVANWKKLVARKQKIKWQRDFFDHRLRNDAEYALKYAYVRQNPVRAGLATDIHSWPHQWPLPDGRESGDLPDVGKNSGMNKHGGLGRARCPQRAEQLPAQGSA